MPIYEYQCEGCGDVFEITQKISDPPLQAHEACGSNKVKKLISATSFQLKGSGWYVTDYKKNTKSDEAKPKDDAKPTEAKPSEAKTDAASSDTAPKADTPKGDTPKAEKPVSKGGKDAA